MRNENVGEAPEARGPDTLWRQDTCTNPVRMSRPLSDFRKHVVSLIEAYLPAGSCSVQAIARHLRIHPRTVNRRLVRSGPGYSHLVQAVRKKRAEELRATLQPVPEIAVQLGFTCTNSFARWLRDTYGYPVRRWRSRSLS